MKSKFYLKERIIQHFSQELVSLLQNLCHYNILPYVKEGIIHAKDKANFLIHF